MLGADPSPCLGVSVMGHCYAGCPLSAFSPMELQEDGGRVRLPRGFTALTLGPHSGLALLLCLSFPIRSSALATSRQRESFH